MSVRKIDVRVGRNATPVGELIYDATGTREASVFTYHQSWLSHPMAFALAPNMPLGSAPFYGTKSGNASALPMPIADSSPDSWGRAIIDVAWRAGVVGTGKGRPTDLDYLLEADDFLRSGALRYFDGPEPNARALAPERENGGVLLGIPSIYSLDEATNASRAFEADPEGYAARRGALIGGELLRNLGSLGGARPKFNAVDNQGRIWIAKLARQDDLYAMGRVEVMALRLARRVGIETSDAEILPTEAQRFPIALVKRFDRADDGGRIPFISAQTFMALPGAEPGNYVDLAQEMRKHSMAPVEEAAELYRRLMFTVLIQNADDHLRNHGFLAQPGGKWKLSPAYDINPVPGNGLTLKTAISELHGNEMSIEAVIDAAPYFDISEDAAAKAAREMAGVIQGEWRAVAAQVGMTPEDMRSVGGAMSNRQIDAALKLGQAAAAPVINNNPAPGR